MNLVRRGDRLPKPGRVGVVESTNQTAVQGENRTDSLDSLLEDAKNRAFFDRAGIAPKDFFSDPERGG
jgi:hypothetical protein